jgi:hypothetical protein
MAREAALYDQPLMFEPCLSWITDRSGEIMVDLIVRLEDIDTKWSEVQTLMGTDVALPKANSAPRAARQAILMLKALRS